MVGGDGSKTIWMKRFGKGFKKTSGGVSEGQTSAALFYVLFPLARPNVGHLFHFKFSFLVQGLAVGLDLLWGTDGGRYGNGPFRTLTVLGLKPNLSFFLQRQLL